MATRSKHSSMHKTLIFFLCIALAGCGATTREPERQSVALPIFPDPDIADTREARLADATGRELTRLARTDPELLAEVSGELETLARALIAAGNREAEAAELATPVTLATTGELAPPPAGMDDAPSLRHGVHLASYRLMENAVAGWSELQAAYPDLLSDRHARLETTDIEGRGEFLRLKAGPFDSAAEAAAICAQLEQAGAYCMPIDFSGRPVATR